jgi:predicted dehydrogenase
MSRFDGSVLRIGILGTAKITPRAVVEAARHVEGVEVVAIASRDPARAERFAAEHDIPHVAQSYSDLLAYPEVDAVYNPLPNGLHGRWSIAALESGKHVLCEKPFAANADEAAAVAALAARKRLVCMEAFPYRYHPMLERILTIIRNDLGSIEHLEAWIYFPLLSAKNIRWDFSLAGGTCMDIGCYPIHLLRSMMGSEPRVLCATARCRFPDVDRWVRAEMEFPNGARGLITASMYSARIFGRGARVVGDRGELRIFNPYTPHLYNRVTVLRRDQRALEHFTHKEEFSSYVFQLRAFCGAALRGEPTPTTAVDAVANMRVIDAVYRAAGLEVRVPYSA